MNADHQPPILDPGELVTMASVLTALGLLYGWLLLLRHAAAAPIF